MRIRASSVACAKSLTGERPASIRAAVPDNAPTALIRLFMTNNPPSILAADTFRHGAPSRSGETFIPTTNTRLVIGMGFIGDDSSLRLHSRLPHWTCQTLPARAKWPSLQCFSCQWKRRADARRPEGNTRPNYRGRISFRSGDVRGIVSAMRCGMSPLPRVSPTIGADRWAVHENGEWRADRPPPW